MMKEIQEAESQVYRAQCRVRCLEANLDRIEPTEFEALMCMLEVARSELKSAAEHLVQIRMRSIYKNKPSTANDLKIDA